MVPHKELVLYNADPAYFMEISPLKINCGGQATGDNIFKKLTGIVNTSFSKSGEFVRHFV